MKKWMIPILFSCYLAGCSDVVPYAGFRPAEVKSAKLDNLIAELNRILLGDNGEKLSELSIEWVEVPMGSFTMGTTSEEARSSNCLNCPYEPANQILHVKTFYISKYEITNAQYKQFVDAGGYSKLNYWTKEGWKSNQWKRPSEWDDTAPYYDGDQFSNLPDSPVVGVSWYEAYAFCQWVGAGLRLPTEAEWEKAARGTDGRAYPWGNDVPKVVGLLKANYHSLERGRALASVTSYPEGGSPYGLLNMAGNAAEWTNSIYLDYPYTEADGREFTDLPEDLAKAAERVVRGGSWSSSILGNELHTAARISQSPSGRAPWIGFRPVTDISAVKTVKNTRKKE